MSRASESAILVHSAITAGHVLDGEPRNMHQLIARDAVRLADALLTELEKSEGRHE